MRTEDEIIKEIKRLKEVNTSVNGRTDVLMEFKRAMSIVALLYAIGKTETIDLGEVEYGR